MTTRKTYECDSCGFTDLQDDPNMTVQIKQCAICGDDFCDQGCNTEHALQECGL
mgnify:FL=1